MKRMFTKISLIINARMRPRWYKVQLTVNVFCGPAEEANSRFDLSLLFRARIQFIKILNRIQLSQ